MPGSGAWETAASALGRRHGISVFQSNAPVAMRGNSAHEYRFVAGGYSRIFLRNVSQSLMSVRVYPAAERSDRMKLRMKDTIRLFDPGNNAGRSRRAFHL
jgi:hypothetical protein